MTIRPTCKSIHKFTTRCHRTHRSKGGRRGVKYGEDKTKVFFLKKKKDEKILDKVIADPVLDILQEAGGEVAPVKTRKKKYADDRPELVCENCSHQIRLDFSPFCFPERLWDVRCPFCGELAYWPNWFKEWVLIDWRVFMVCSWMRAQIKCGNMTLKYILANYGYY